uniref:Uncharacterized protein n=1 Tax=Setaria italica TaxID=4555 RepID=K4A3T7_SETIT
MAADLHYPIGQGRLLNIIYCPAHPMANLFLIADLTR